MDSTQDTVLRTYTGTGTGAGTGTFEIFSFNHKILLKKVSPGPGSRKYIFLSGNQMNCVYQNKRISSKTGNALIIQISIYHQMLVSLRYDI